MSSSDGRPNAVEKPKETPPERGKDLSEHTTISFRRIRLGVWELVLPATSGLDLGHVTLPANFQPLRSVLRFLRDIYFLAPKQFVSCILFNVYESLRGTLELYLNSQMIDLVSKQVHGNAVHPMNIFRVAAARILVSIATIEIEEFTRRDIAILNQRIRFGFMKRMLQTSLNLDYATMNNPDAGPEFFASIEEDTTSSTFESIVTSFRSLFETVSLLLLAYTFIHKHMDAPVFLGLCLLQPMINYFEEVSLWKTTYVSFCSNTIYRRLAALHDLAFGSRYRMDLLSDGAVNHLRKEFAHNRKILGDVSISPVDTQWYSRPSSFGMELLDSNLDDVPMIYLALKCAFGSQNETFGSLAILQETKSCLGCAIHNLRSTIHGMASWYSELKQIYAAVDMQSSMKDGETEYPGPLDRDRGATGMELEFRNVTYVYPNQERPALKNLSFKVKPGQMVVIVGVNGSGKSSAIKLFNRLYDPTEGEILVDGLPLKTYKIADVRRAIAILRQDHAIYPVSVGENIALGCPGRTPTEEDLKQAVQGGGVDSFIRKLDKGMDTVLDPPHLKVAGGPSKELRDEMYDLVETEESADLSGGERQRLAASRMFMRLLGGDVRLLAVDQPTSALDPECEYKLLQHLKNESGKKTVIFVTHRFGHLTKHADMILCLKDGCLVEHGTHEDLIAKRGEYFKLHSVQAEGFTDSDNESGEQSEFHASDDWDSESD